MPINFPIDPNLNKRQLNILFAVVKEFCDTGKLVGSNQIKDKFQLDVSSATIRNELALLKKGGYITQPFTSSGSKPTEKGFRLFVEELMIGLQMTSKEQRKLKKKLFEMEDQQKKMNLVITKFLASQTGGVGFTIGEDEQYLSGLPSLLSSDTNETESVATILEFLDNLPNYKHALLEYKDDYSKLKDELPLTDKVDLNRITTIIGKENPVIPLSSDYSLMATEVTLEDGEKSVVGIIASTRLLVNQKNLALVKYLSELLSKNQE
jgi:transcriptional regulator of heat shock response